MSDEYKISILGKVNRATHDVLSVLESQPIIFRMAAAIQAAAIYSVAIANEEKALEVSPQTIAISQKEVERITTRIMAITEEEISKARSHKNN